MVLYIIKDDFSGKHGIFCDVEFIGNDGALFNERHVGLDKFVDSGVLRRIDNDKEIGAYQRAQAAINSSNPPVVTTPVKQEDIQPPSGNSNYDLASDPNLMKGLAQFESQLQKN